MSNMTRVERKMRRRRRNTLIIIIIVIIVTLINIFKKMDYFNIKAVDMHGLRVLNRANILNEVDFDVGTNLFDVKMLKNKKKLKGLTYIEDAKITFKLPDRLIIDIDERKESLLIKDQDSNNIILDQNGIILNIIEQMKNNIILVEGFKLESLKKEDIGNNIDEYIKDEKILDFLNRISNVEFSKDAHRVVFTEDSVIIYMKENRQINFGKLRNVEYKFDSLEEILKQLKDKGINFTKIFMDKGDNPIIIKDDIEEIEESGVEEEG